MTRFAPGVCCLVLAVALGACGGPRRPTERGFDRLYKGLADPFPRVTPTTLAGFRILIDPGHGGSFRGTVGRDSLEESRVNLGVSLYLWGLLRDAGADVHLTRTSDRDFLTAADSTLVFDLQARVNAVDSLRPDLFVSIHHNAQPDRDPAYNRIETYYKAGDPASLDLAFAIHRHLMRNLGIGAGEVRQGNYYILRNAGVPAVLGESSYLTHPPVEEKLRLSRAQELEAEAYFLGIVDYCRRGIPRVTSITPADSLRQDVPAVVCEFEDHGGLGIDPDGVTMSINGEPARARLSADGRRAVYDLPWDAPNGAYEVAVTARNLRGNTSPVARVRFALAHPAAMAAINTEPASLPRSGGTVRVRARMLDGRGLPVADGTPVTLTSSLGGSPRGGIIERGSVEFALPVPPGVTRDAKITVTCQGRSFDASVPAGRDAGGRWRSVVIRGHGGTIADARIVAGDSTLAGPSPSGVYGYPAGRAAVVRAPGHRPAELSDATPDTLRLEAWFGGALVGKRFVLDPQGGPPATAGVGPMGLAASHVNLRMSSYLEGFLRAAGAQVLTTRTSEEVRLPEDIARMTNRFRADRYIELRHPALPPESTLAVRAYFFPGSQTGRAMARDVGVTLAEQLGVAFSGPRATVTYPLQQTACPAVVVAAPSISKVEEELRLDSSAYLRRQAYAVFTGILRHFGAADRARLTVVVQSAPGADWMVTLDDTWTLMTGSDGSVTFDTVPAGEHRITVRRGSVIARQEIVTANADARITVVAAP